MVSFTFPKDGQKQLDSQDSGFQRGPLDSQMVAVSGHCQGLFLPRTPAPGSYNGRQPVGALLGPRSAGQMEPSRPQGLATSINWLVLCAIYLALLQFRQPVLGKHILALTDNVAMKAHINHLGGTRSKSLMLEAMRLGLWAERHLQYLTAERISVVSNVQVDWLSRTVIDHMEWHLHPPLFWDLMDRFGTPEVD